MLVRNECATHCWENSLSDSICKYCTTNWVTKIQNQIYALRFRFIDIITNSKNGAKRENNGSN